MSGRYVHPYIHMYVCRYVVQQHEYFEGRGFGEEEHGRAMDKAWTEPMRVMSRLMEKTGGDTKRVCGGVERGGGDGGNSGTLERDIQ